MASFIALTVSDWPLSSMGSFQISSCDWEFKLKKWNSPSGSQFISLSCRGSLESLPSSDLTGLLPWWTKLWLKRTWRKASAERGSARISQGEAHLWVCSRSFLRVLTLENGSEQGLADRSCASHVTSLKKAVYMWMDRFYLLRPYLCSLNFFPSTCVTWIKLFSGAFYLDCSYLSHSNLLLFLKKIFDLCILYWGISD